MDPTDTDGIDLTHVAPLADDDIPDQNQAHFCFSCNEPINGVYCAACGNKNDNYRRSIWSLAGELFASLTALENRMWRSLISLIIRPGQMAREFADGARQKWTSPVRMYLAMSIILFGYIAFTQTQLVALGTVIDQNSPIQANFGGKNYMPRVYFLERKSVIRSEVTDDALEAFENDLVSIIGDDAEKTLKDLEKELENVRESANSLQNQIDNATNKYAAEGMKSGKSSIERRIKELEEIIERRKNPVQTAPPSSDDDAASSFLKGIRDGYAEAQNEDNAEAKPQILGNQEDSAEQSKEEAEEENDSGSNVKITGFDGRNIQLDSAGLRKVIALAVRDPARLNAPINRHLPRIMFFMMPLSMLFGALFIRSRENAMLFDHLVHAAYIHAFSFLLLFIFILLTQFTSLPGLLFIYTVILLVYLPVSAKRMFGRGWFKSILASYSVGLFYTIVMGCILMGLILSGVLDLAADVSANARTIITSEHWI